MRSRDKILALIVIDVILGFLCLVNPLLFGSFVAIVSSLVGAYLFLWKRECRVIKGVIKRVLNPLISQLERKINHLNPLIDQMKGEIGFSGWREDYLPGEIKHYGEEEYFTNDFGGRCPKLKKMVDDYNEYSKIQRTKVENLIKRVADDERFEKICREVKEEHNKNASPERQLSDNFMEKHKLDFARNVIFKLEDLGEGKYRGMWKNHWCDFFGIKEREDIRSEIGGVVKSLERNTGNAVELLKKLKKQRREWINNCDIPREDVEIKSDPHPLT